MRFRRDGRHFTTAMIKWFGSLKKSAQIALIVSCSHLFAIIWASVDHVFTFEKKPHSLFVRTISAPQAIVARSSQQPFSTMNAPSQTPTNSSRKKTPPQKVKTTSPKTTASRPSQTKKTTTAAKSTRTAKKTTASSTPTAAPAKKINSAAIEEIKQNFANISESKRAAIQDSPDIPLPSFIEPKDKTSTVIEEQSSSTTESTYPQSLMETLQSSLDLPEMGEVTMKIVIQAPGIIQTMEVIDAHSKKNAAWLKEQLPFLELPCFQDFGIVDAFLEFTIKFKNAENH